MAKKRVPPFRAFLISKGWTTEKFKEKAEAKGVHISIMSAFKWARGTVPRDTRKRDLEDRFPGIKF